MPRVKFDYVVSFSSEYPDNQANNLLATEISKKKWLCCKGEPSCSVVLQMSKSVKISAVHIGAFQASLVEVLVGRSESPSEPYQVLVASNVFLSPAEARREQSVERVRSFSEDQLSSPARHQRWDRLRIVCSQPYNKHCKYGLSFIHVFEPEAADAAQCTAVPNRLLNLDTFSSDEDDFQPGELFAKHLENSQDKETHVSASTEVQIRHATSQALKNLSDSKTKLKKTSTPKPVQHFKVDRGTTTRHRNSLLYDDDDEKPNPKVDSILKRHSHNKMKTESAIVDTTTLEEEKTHKKKSPELEVKDLDKHKESSHHTRDKTNKPAPGQERNANRLAGDATPQGNKQGTKGVGKRTHSDMSKENIAQARGGTAPHELLRHAVLVFSGYVNPQRARARTAALALGAACRPDWDSACTHLICAFPNTPKLRAVRARPGGASVPVVRADWIEQCVARARLLPWEWFATEDERRVAPPADYDDNSKEDSECDTDDEIEKALQQSKQHKHSARVSTPAEHTSRGDGGALTESDTDLEDNLQIDESKALPDFFDGVSFVVARDEPECDAAQAERYVRAYGGLLLDEVQLEQGCVADYLVSVVVACGVGVASGATRVVRPDWLWQCHAEQRLCPPDEYSHT